MILLPLVVSSRRQETAPGTSLGALADGLAAELTPWLSRGLPIPEQKARLTRDGGRCPVHGTLLEFDPLAPTEHRCRRCGTVYTGETHHQWWVMGAHLFTAERAVHAAALYLLRGVDAHRQLAVQTLSALATQYAQWPNRDNVLGPTRPFFSTYLESIWLLNLCHALALLEVSGERSVSDVLRERVLEPSSTLIASYHEGRSNRQVWNEVALLSALSMLGNDAQIDRRLDGEQSLLGLMSSGLLDDGTWYEGENYHQFAHRGLWYGVQWLAARGRALPAALAARFHHGFVTPFAGLLPDETLPARRDSQYGVSVRQWRWAEWCELGYAASGDSRLAAMLGRIYDGHGPQGASGRAQSTADAERNRDPVALTRADCSWRALLMANPQPVPEARWVPGSVLQPQQGLAVIRRDSARVYVALEGGVDGGAHGHPDRLSLTLQTGPDRWLDDPGTGSYVEHTLHWYRSSLAHYAPVIDGASQQQGPAFTTAFEDRGGAGWIRKTASDLAPGVSATRSIIVCDGYLVDLLEWSAAKPVTLTLPLASAGITNVPHWQPIVMTGAGGLEDGFDFLQHPERAVDAPTVVTIDATVTGRRPDNARRPRVARAWYTTSGAADWWRGVVPGAPGCESSTRVAVSMEGRSGRIVGVWSWSEEGAADVQVTDVTFNAQGTPVASVTTRDGTVASHEPAPHGWHVGLVARASRSSIDLEGVLPISNDVTMAHTPAITRPQHVYALPLLANVNEVERAGIVLHLDAPHYVRTEEPWGGDNRPVAELRLGATVDALVLSVEVATGHVPVVPPAAQHGGMPDNPLDNERADVNADGVQCYLGVPGEVVGQWHQAVLCVPLSTGDVRSTVLVPGGVPPHATSQSTATGWRLTLSWPREALPPGPLTLDVVVNERPPHRERRRGQLVLSGGGGFAYLRGDRHAPHAPVELHVP